MNEDEFSKAFAALTGNPPFPWQWEMYKLFIVGEFRSSCSLPTGLGKTSIIHIWLLALAHAPTKVPRRLVYVVNRRTVVDQSTDEAMKLRDQLLGEFGPPIPIVLQVKEDLQQLVADPARGPLAISTLRGQFADNREWSADPARPAIIAGTVDMIGSRLLFSGYGCGFKTRPLHAGFLGQDVLLVHDEAHLEPAFQELLIAIKKEQDRCNEFRTFRVMELSATSRGGDNTFELTPQEKNPPPTIFDPPTEPIHVVWRRLKAKKAVNLHENQDEKKLADELASLAMKDRGPGQTVLIFVRKVEDVEKVVKKLPKDSFEILTGTLRGKERDELVERPIFRRFLPKAEPSKDTVYLVCTSAGEVGVNISADHLVCDLTPFDSMAQRFGRVNRFGDRDDTRIDIVYPKEKDLDEKDDYDSQVKKTLGLVRELNGDGSPAGLGKLDMNRCREAFSPQPTILPVSDILFDAWALTTIRGKLPGRPPVEPYLHGVSNDPPQTTIAWREEVAVLTPKVLHHNKLDPEDVLDLYPLKPHEQLRLPTYGKNKAFEQLEAIAARDAKHEPNKRLSAWVIEPDGSVTIYPLQKLIEKDNRKPPRPLVSLAGRTVLLPPHAGGFSGGLLQGNEPFVKAIEYDVSEEWYQDAEQTKQHRRRGWGDDDEFDEKTEGMRLIRRIDLPPSEDDEDTPGRSWYWFTRPNSADDDGSKSAKAPITWQHHTTDVENGAKALADKLLQAHPDLHTALVHAAKFHDLGKKRIVWQRSIGNPNPTDWHAKSGKDPKTGRVWRPTEITDYRHEFGSLIDCDAEKDFQKLPDEVKELVLHLISVHHGNGRPHFPKAFDPERSEMISNEVARAVPRRFAKLQRKYGRWGLAYLESLLRAADYAASANPSQIVEVK